MAPTYELIASNTLTTDTASVTFSSIPATYTDLVLRWSIRSTANSFETSGQVQVNSSTTTYSNTYLRAQSSSASSGRLAVSYHFLSFAVNGDIATANTFASGEMYLPNYLSSDNKVFSFFTASEGNNNTDPGIAATAGLWRNSSAITSVTFLPASDNIKSGSSFFLYGIKSS
jgi:hypothetical protein